MNIVIAGGTGFIGKKLTDFLVQKGHQITILTRKTEKSEKNVSYVTWLTENAEPVPKINGTDIVINLAGVSINDGRWTKKHQKQIYQSRMEATEKLLQIIESLPNKPKTFINASAIGLYPSSLNVAYTESSPEKAEDFLAKTVIDWEKKAKAAEKFGVRTVFMRFGVVLGKGDGALPLMTFPYKLFVGGTVGSGKQWLSWIHVVDVVRSIIFAMDNEHISGPVNVVAPTPVRMEQFGRIIGSVLKRPHWFTVPAFLLKIALGQKSRLVLEGQHVIPKVLLDNGFNFHFPTVEKALADLLGK